jgi:hypothetical protein
MKCYIISHIQVLPFVLRHSSVQSTNQFLRLNLLVILTNKIITLVALLYVIILFKYQKYCCSYPQFEWKVCPSFYRYVWVYLQ